MEEKMDLEQNLKMKVLFIQDYFLRILKKVQEFFIRIKMNLLEDILKMKKQNFMVIGKMMNKLIQDLKYGLILQIISENIIMVKKKVLEHIYGMIIQNTKENGKIII